MRHDGVDIYALYKVLMEEAIPKLARGDKILDQSMKASVAREVRTKYNADTIPLKKPFAKCPLVAPARETTAAE